ncbi:Preprotein translocase subunit SCY2, chloroplastic-like protein [Drosera capensis]
MVESRAFPLVLPVFRDSGGSELNFSFHGPKHARIPFRLLDCNLLMQNHPLRKPVVYKASGRIFADNLQNAFLNFGEASRETVNHDHLPKTDVCDNIPDPHDVKDGGKESIRHTKYKNKFFIFLRLGSIVNNAADSFFKSEIRRRICVTIALLVISRVGYYIPLPGFDRRLIPRDYLSFDSASAREDLINYSPELKMSLFQLGIGPQIAASIIMQMACHLMPSLVKLRKEGSDGYEKIKYYIWWISLGFAILGALLLGCFSLQYSIYEAGHR